MKWERSLEHTLAFARARLAGDYAVDEFGFDPEFTEVVLLPILRLLAEKWFRVELRGGADRLPPGGVPCWWPTTPARCRWMPWSCTP